MRIKNLLIGGVVATLLLSSCQAEFGKGIKVEDNSSVTMPKEKVDSLSEALGTYFAVMINSDNFGNLNWNKFLTSFETAIENNANQKEMTYAVQTIQQFLMEKNNLIGEHNKAEGQSFLEQNKTVEGVQTTESGLQYQIVQEGTGDYPTEEDTVICHYIGTNLNGYKFDSSYDRGEPAEFPLSGVIKGWTEGIQKINEGGKITLWIPSELAYGTRAISKEVGPNSTLKFEVELIEIKAEEE